MDAGYIEELEALDKDHFWFKAKAKYLRRLINKPEAIILDVGCGSGGNMAEFIKHNYRVIGIDINDRAISACRQRGYKVFKADLEKEIPNIQCIPDYIVAFDFIEHIHNPIELLRNLKKLAGSETRLIVTVPSYQSLFSKWDDAIGHVKRYRQAAVRKELTEAGWQVVHSTHIHILPLLPAIFMRKIIQPIAQKLRKTKINKREKFFTLPLLLNNLIYKMYFPEFAFFRLGLPLPFGLSIIAVAQPQKKYLIFMNF